MQKPYTKKKMFIFKKKKISLPPKNVNIKPDYADYTFVQVNPISSISLQPFVMI